MDVVYGFLKDKFGLLFLFIFFGFVSQFLFVALSFVFYHISMILALGLGFFVSSFTVNTYIIGIKFGLIFFFGVVIYKLIHK